MNRTSAVILTLSVLVGISVAIADWEWETSANQGSLVSLIEHIKGLCLNPEVNSCDASLCQILFKKEFTPSYSSGTAKRQSPPGKKQPSPYGNQLTFLRFGRRRRSTLRMKSESTNTK